MAYAALLRLPVSFTIIMTLIFGLMSGSNLLNSAYSSISQPLIVKDVSERSHLGTLVNNSIMVTVILTWELRSRACLHVHIGIS
jgi:hypothetical protein